MKGNEVRKEGSGLSAHPKLPVKKLVPGVIYFIYGYLLSCMYVCVVYYPAFSASSSLEHLKDKALQTVRATLDPLELCLQQNVSAGIHDYTLLKYELRMINKN